MSCTCGLAVFRNANCRNYKPRWGTGQDLAQGVCRGDVSQLVPGCASAVYDNLAASGVEADSHHEAAKNFHGSDQLRQIHALLPSMPSWSMLQWHHMFSIWHSLLQKHRNYSPCVVRTIVRCQDVLHPRNATRPIPEACAAELATSLPGCTQEFQPQTCYVLRRCSSIPAHDLVVLVWKVHADVREAVAWSHFIMRPRRCCWFLEVGMPGLGLQEQPVV